jgi:hypothetical protein
MEKARRKSEDGQGMQKQDREHHLVINETPPVFSAPNSVAVQLERRLNAVSAGERNTMPDVLADTDENASRLSDLA